MRNDTATTGCARIDAKGLRGFDHGSIGVKLFVGTFNVRERYGRTREVSCFCFAITIQIEVGLASLLTALVRVPLITGNGALFEPVYGTAFDGVDEG